MAVILLAGCATKSEDISASYVSPNQYASFSCAQLRDEAARISSRAVQANGEQNNKASNDSVKMGVGLILFWPTLFFIKGDGATAAEVARLKGEMESVETTSVQKKCGIEFRRS